MSYCLLQVMFKKKPFQCLSVIYGWYCGKWIPYNWTNVILLLLYSVCTAHTLVNPSLIWLSNDLPFILNTHTVFVSQCPDFSRIGVTLEVSVCSVLPCVLFFCLNWIHSLWILKRTKLMRLCAVCLSVDTKGSISQGRPTALQMNHTVRADKR